MLVQIDRSALRCRPDERTDMTENAPEESVEELAAALPTAGAVIDVRSPEDYAAGHVPGALNVPLDDVLADPSRSYGGGTVHVVCQSGKRSAQAASAMTAAGVHAVSVAGGTSAWSESGRPVEQ